MPTNDNRYVVLLGARSGVHDEGSQILGPRVLGVFNYDDAHAAVAKAEKVWARENVRRPFGEPYAEVVHLGVVDPLFGIAHDAEGWVTTEACSEFDEPTWSREDDLCVTCGFEESEHNKWDDDEEDED